MNALNRKSIADVTHRIGRSVLMILGILLGVLGITAVNQASDQLSGTFFYSTDPTAVPNITMSVDSLPASVAATIRHLPSVQRVQLCTVYGAPWYVAGHAEGNIEISAYPNMQNIQLAPFQITAGHLPGPGEIVLDGRNLLEGYPTQLGDTITLATPAGHTVGLRVVGLSRTQGVGLGALAGFAATPIGYMSPTGLQRVVGQEMHQAGGGFLRQEILVQTPDSSVVQTYNAMAQLMAREHITVATKASNWRYASGRNAAQLSVVGPLRVVQFLSLLLLLLVCSLIFNTVTTLLTEQMKIIGTMKALGGTRWRIAGSYLFTIAIYSVVGTAVGLELGLVAGYQLAVHLASTVQLNIGPATVALGAGPFQVSPWVPLTGMLVGLLVPMLSALWPLWVGTRITIRTAMSAYGVHVLQYPTTFALGRSLAWVPQTVWLGLRGLFRHPGRSTFTLLTLGLAGALFLSVEMANSSLALSEAQQFSPIVNPDVRVELSDRSQAVVPGLQKLANVESVVPMAFADGLVGDRRIFLAGVPTDQYRPNLVAGRWLQSHERGSVVLNEVAAQRLHLQIDQYISIQVTPKGQQHVQSVNVHWKIVGLMHATDYLSGSADPNGTLGEAIVTMDQLNTTLGQPQDYADRVVIHAHDRSPQAVLQLKTTIEHFIVQLGETGAQVQTLQELTQGFVDPLSIIYILFYAVALLVALIGLLSLALTLVTSVLERRMEIGILRSLGATGWQVSTVFWIEGLTLSILAWALGILFGLPGGLILVQVLGTFLGPLDVSISPLFILSTLLFVLTIAGLASCGPTLMASRMSIRSILRYE